MTLGRERRWPLPSVRPRCTLPHGVAIVPSAVAIKGCSERRAQKFMRRTTMLLDISRLAAGQLCLDRERMTFFAGRSPSRLRLLRYGACLKRNPSFDARGGARHNASPIS
jgi:hypothetical protein